MAKGLTSISSQFRVGNCRRWAIVTIVIENREQIEILDSLADSEGIIPILRTVDVSTMLSFEKAIQSIEAAKELKEKMPIA
jgi:hypothetical protein